MQQKLVQAPYKALDISNQDRQICWIWQKKTFLREYLKNKYIKPTQHTNSLKYFFEFSIEWW